MSIMAIIGIGVGFIILMLFIALLSTAENEPTTHFNTEIVANADNKRKVLSSDAPVILKLNIDGTIGSERLNNDTIRNLLIESREGVLKNDRVKAILLNLNTPGGTVVDADGIYHAIKSYKEQYKAPVYAYVDGLCASGGMYVASAADQIYASNSSIIGSIGVLAPPFLNFTQLLEKLGVQALTITAGKDKDELNPLREWKQGEGDNIRDLIDHYYHQFVDIVVTSRPEVNREKLINDYGAKVFDAKQAQANGFITASGYSLNDTLKLLLKKINIDDDYYQVMEMQKKTWWNDLISGEWSLLRGRVVHQIQLTPGLDSSLNNQFLYLYQP